MKYALLIYAAPDTSPLSGAEARQAWLDFARAASEAGVLLGAERLAATDTATSVRVRGGQRLLTDGNGAATSATINTTLQQATGANGGGNGGGGRQGNQQSWQQIWRQFLGRGGQDNQQDGGM